LVGGGSVQSYRYTSSGGSERRFDIRQESSRYSKVNRGTDSKLSQADRTFHQIADDTGPNCWEIKKCGRIPGGDKVVEFGICPAYPNDGRNCWGVAGTFCGGKVQGNVAQKRGGCLTCDFYKDVRKNGKVHSAANHIPFDDDFREFCN